MLTCTFENGHSTTNLRHTAVHALVIRENTILLEKRADHLVEGGKWALPGGYIDRDETASEAVIRELREETGWEGEVISCFRINSNPNREKDRQNIIFEYIVRPIRQVGGLDHETAAIAWVKFDQLLPFEEYAFDHGDSIRLCLEYLKKPFPIPIVV